MKKKYRKAYNTLKLRGDSLCQQLNRPAITEWWEQQREQELSVVLRALSTLEIEKRNFDHVDGYEPYYDPSTGRYFPENTVKSELLPGFKKGFIHENVCEQVCKFEEEL